MSPNAIMTVIFLINMVSLMGGVFVSEFYTGVNFMCDIGTILFIIFSCRWFFERERELVSKIKELE